MPKWLHAPPSAVSVSALELCLRLTGAAKLLAEHFRARAALAAHLTQSPQMLSTWKWSQEGLRGRVIGQMRWFWTSF